MIFTHLRSTVYGLDTNTKVWLLLLKTMHVYNINDSICVGFCVGNVRQPSW